MSSMKSWSAALLAVSAATTAFSADAPWTYTTAVRVSVDATGHAKVLHFSREIPKGLIASTTAKIDSWEFEPAKHDGVAVASETNLFVRYDVRAVGRDYSFDIAGVEVGAGITQMELPSYPMAAIQSHQAGRVLLRVDIDDEGKPTEVVDVSDKKLRYLAPAAIEAVRRWRFEPQRVDGIAIVEPLWVPIDFRLTTSSNEPTILQKNDHKAAALPPPPSSEQIASSEQPVVKLLTRLQP